jgi:hypothetical protein
MTRIAAAVLCGGPAAFAAAQDAPAPKPLVRLDLLVLGPGEAPPPLRDIFRPRTAAPAAAARPGGPAVRPVPGGPAVAPAPAFALNISYLGSIKSGGRVIGLVLRGGQTLDVGEGDEIAPGYRVVGVTAEAIVVEGPNGERKTFAKQGDRP